MIEAVEEKSLDHDADEADQHRRVNEAAGKADALGKQESQIGADRVERAMRQIDDAAEREDQRQAKRDQQLVDAEEQAVEDLLAECRKMNHIEPSLWRILARR